ncbi:MAG: polyprenyl synthetase family protein [Prevotellaceae bacterium]|nr:polyprenyl synthetase family protein [Prevotellaceae bacterium]
MHTFSQLTQMVEQALSQLALPASPNLLYAPMRYALQSGGKRIRPVMTLMCAEIFIQNIDNEIVNIALAVELFHTFTLIHDDIMDHADLRRGVPTVVKKWDTNVAILSGDGMLIEAYRLLCGAPNAAEVLKVFNRAAIEVCEGQQLDVDFELLPTISLEQYYEMVGRKTAVLLAAAASIGAVAAGAPAADVEHLRSFAYKLGLAFQVQDDYLDCYSNAEEFGKATGGDIIEQKKTFLFVSTTAVLKEKELADFICLMQNTTLERTEKITQVKAVYAKVGVEKMVHNEVEKLFAEAMQHLAEVNVADDKKTEIKNLALAIMQRKK